MLAALDLKLEEKIRDLKQSQEAEICNLRKLVLARRDIDLPLKVEAHQR